MHYLIQKTTRQHIAVDDDMPCPVECLKVRADAEGWVTYNGTGCPVPDESLVDVINECGRVMLGVPAAEMIWPFVLKYRPDGHEWRDGETADDLPASIPASHETAAMLLSVVCAFAIGALIGWGWM